MDFVRAFELVIANSSFLKKENHLVEWRGFNAKWKQRRFLMRRW